MIIWKKEKPELIPGEERWRPHYCLLPCITSHAVFWLCEIIFVEEWYYDASIGKWYWKKKAIKYYDKERRERVTIPY